MKKNDYILIISVVFYTLLLYKQLPGLNFLILNILLVAFLLWRNLKLVKNINWLLTAAGSLATAYCIAWHGNFLSFTGNIISLSILSGLSFNTRSSVIFSLLFSVYSYFSSIVFMALAYIEKRRKTETENPENSTPYLKLLMIGIPFIVFFIFFFMYRAANPVFNNFAAKLNIDFISFEWIRFTLGGIVLMYGFWYHKEIPALAAKDANAANTLHMEQLGQPTFLGKILGLVNENLSGIILLSLLNILLLTVNILDIEFLFLGGKLPEGLSHSQSVHQGIGMLITSIVCAILIILYYFRGNLNFYENNKALKLLAYLWVVQNAFMIISTAYRNELYIDEYSLTYKRIGVFIYLLLALIGLATTLIKIASVKSSWFLFRKNAWLFYVVLVISCFISWDMLITNFNIQRAEKNNKFLDKDYLLNLSFNNIPVLLQMSDTATTYYGGLIEDEAYIDNKGNKETIYYYPKEDLGAGHFNAQLHNKIYYFFSEQQQADWRSWSYDRSKTEKEIQQLIRKLKVESITLASNNYNTLAPFKDFKQLNEINFANNNLSDLGGLKNFTELEKLNLSNNRLDSITGFPVLNKLIWLDISHNQITDATPLANAKQLQELDICNNPNLQLKDGFPVLPNLKSLDLSGNNTGDLSGLSKLPALEKLVINYNSVRIFNEVPDLEKLKILHIKSNNLSSDNFEIRNKIKVFKNLIELDISDNDITFFNYFNDNYNTFQDYLNDKEGVLAKNFTPVFPNLQVLDLSSNNLNKINGIGSFKNLKKLNLKKTAIDNLEPLSVLEELTELDLSYNNISIILPVKNLTKLETLDLSHNTFSIPEELFYKHQKLTKLNLAFCNIGSVKLIADAPSIKDLDLSNNYLTSLDGIENMQTLENLNLTGNYISDFRPLYKLKNLKTLQVEKINNEALIKLQEALPQTNISRQIN